MSWGMLDSLFATPCGPRRVRALVDVVAIIGGAAELVRYDIFADQPRRRATCRSAVQALCHRDQSRQRELVGLTQSSYDIVDELG
jgi:hypothetical protein